MSDPKRWTDSGSEVDPVLQSVLRYAQNVRPTPEQVSSLVERLDASASAPVPAPPRALGWKALVAGTVAAVAAAASYADLARVAPPRAVVTTERVRPPSVPEMTPQPDLPLKAPEVEPSSPPERSVVPVPASRSKPVPPPSVTRTPPPEALEIESPVDPEGVGLLQEARREVASAPMRTLSLTAQHAAEFPKSALREEREALRIQALFRLRRTKEAESELARFEAAYPSSPYRRQLRHDRPVLPPGAE